MRTSRDEIAACRLSFLASRFEGVLRSCLLSATRVWGAQKWAVFDSYPCQCEDWPLVRCGLLHLSGDRPLGSERIERAAPRSVRHAWSYGMSGGQVQTACIIQLQGGERSRVSSRPQLWNLETLLRSSLVASRLYPPASISPFLSALLLLTSIVPQFKCCITSLSVPCSAADEDH